jgi:23S rRNA (pseudouridine1915-N3)-methyltransferase
MDEVSIIKVRVIAVGTIKEAYLKRGIEYYLKILNRNGDVTIQEIPEAKIPEKASEADIRRAVTLESERVLKAVSTSDRMILLDAEGTLMSTREVKKKMHVVSDGGRLPLVFVIGGSHGVEREMFSDKAFSLSFSKMTFPHQLMRLVLLEQLSQVMDP